MFDNEAPLGEAQVPDHLLEAQAVELAVRPLEGGIGGDPLGNLRVGNPKPQRAQVSMDASIMTMSAYRFPELADISQTGAKTGWNIKQASRAYFKDTDKFR